MRRFTVLVASLLTALAALLPASPAHAASFTNGWEYLGGEARGGPAITAWSGGRLDVFVRGTDDALWHKAYDSNTGQWTAWDSLGGVLRSAPGAVSWGTDRIDVFVRGTDDAVWHRWLENGAWSVWESLGGVVTSSPAAAATAFNRIDLLAKGTDNRIWSRRWSGESWNNWAPTVGQEFASGPAATNSTGQVIAAAKGTDNGGYVFATDSTNTTWQNPAPIGGVIVDDPALTWRPADKSVYVRGTDNQLWMWHYDDANTPGWTGLGGQLTAGPAAVLSSPVRTDIVVRGTDNAIWHTWGSSDSSSNGGSNAG